MPRHPLGRTRAVPAASALALVVSLLAGCGDKETSTQSGERRLTDGKGTKEYPCVSPDGGWVVYSVSSGEGHGKRSLHMVPVEGGEPRALGVSGYCLGYRPRGDGILVLNLAEMSVDEFAFEGERVTTLHPQIPLAWPVASSPDGKRVLYRKYSGDNLDLGIKAGSGAEIDLLAETPGWEIDAVFGPGPDQVTVVRQDVYQSAEVKIAIWSPQEEGYASLPLPEARNVNPNWSRDGSLLAFASNQSGTFDIYLYEPTSGRTIQVTSGPEDDLQPGWGPGRDWLAFSRRSETAHVFVGDPGTREVRQITDGEGRDRNPVVSPDGRWVAFARYPASTEGRPIHPQLCVVPVSGGEVRPLDLGDLNPQVGPDPGRYCWSPDASQIVFSADDGSGNVDVYRVSRTGGEPNRVTIRPGVDIYPTWSPDGSTIAYTRRAGGETQVCVIPATGGNPRQVSNGSGLSQHAVWAPDSDRLAYIRFSAEGKANVETWITSAGGRTGPRALIQEGVNVPFAWSADGSEVLVWREADHAYDLVAMGVEGGGETVLTAEAEKPDSKEHFLDLNQRGKSYLDRIYPGGVHAFSDGSSVADIYITWISDLLASELSLSGLE